MADVDLALGGLNFSLFWSLLFVSMEGLFEMHSEIAIREAFDAAVRQIENVMREFRGQVKHHAEASHGRVKNLLAGEDCGFIETADGRQIYFHRNAVLDAAFDRLKVGSEVAFAEEEVVKGPQASTVRVVGGHRRA